MTGTVAAYGAEVEERESHGGGERGRERERERKKKKLSFFLKKKIYDRRMHLF